MNIIVIGAGTMGQGIAQSLAMYKNRVYIIEQNEQQRNKAFENISLSLKKFVSKGVCTEDNAIATMQNIHFGMTLEQLSKEPIQLVIEAIYENELAKGKIFQLLGTLFSAETILASNTSSISISTLSQQTTYPERVIGMHFMNPVPLMKLVEIITTEQTSSTTLQLIKDLTIQIDKTPCIVKDYPGFIANRILMPMINEAILAFEQGISDIVTIDTICKLGFAHPMGPFKLADLIGLDICFQILEILENGFQDKKYKPAQILKKLVQNGMLGKKTGKGFYIYANTLSEPEINPVVFE
ncbi:MAG: 3-hydroxyacyl-CoA dehydrogenase NAD-binding domain-containing protein [Sediminibacterium sp.]|nr:3-hydroxyacyl-CoA dehydrogenase NAD-binding domain-containing protein [Sediminibacterium sp.]